jgi:hypothetical protein
VGIFSKEKHMFKGELELEAELENLMSVLAESNLEAEAQDAPNQPPGILAFQIPEAPYSDSAMQWLHKSINVFESAHMATSVFSELLTATVGVAAFEAGATILAAAAAMIAPILPIASGITAGRADASRTGVRLGFPLGVVMGANGSQWATVKNMFGKKQADPGYDFDPGAGVEEARGFNAGLVTGWAQGQEVAKNPNKKRFFWSSLYRVMSADAKKLIADWKPDTRKDFYYAAARAFNQLYIKN